MVTLTLTLLAPLVIPALALCVACLWLIQDLSHRGVKHMSSCVQKQWKRRSAAILLLSLLLFCCKPLSAGEETIKDLLHAYYEDLHLFIHPFCTVEFHRSFDAGSVEGSQKAVLALRYGAYAELIRRLESTGISIPENLIPEQQATAYLVNALRNNLPQDVILNGTTAAFSAWVIQQMAQRVGIQGVLGITVGGGCLLAKGGGITAGLLSWPVLVGGGAAAGTWYICSLRSRNQDLQNIFDRSYYGVLRERCLIQKRLLEHSERKEKSWMQSWF